MKIIKAKKFTMIKKINKGSTKEEVLRAVERDPLDLQNASSEIRADKEVVMKALSKDGLALKSASIKLKNQRDVCLAAVFTNGMAFRFVPSKMINTDKEDEIIQTALMQNPNVTKYLTRDQIIMNISLNRKIIQRDSEVILKHLREKAILIGKSECLLAVAQNGHAIRYIPEELKYNREVALQAVKQNGCAIMHIDIRYGNKNDFEIAKAAVSQHGEAYRYLNTSFYSNRELLLIALKTWAYAYINYHQYSPSSPFKNDMGVIWELLKYHNDWFRAIQDNFEENLRLKTTILQITVQNENQIIASSIAGTIVAAFEADDPNDNYELKRKISELSGIAEATILLDTEPNTVIAKGKNMGKIGKIVKNMDKMCIVELEDGSKVRISKDSILEVNRD